VTRPGSCVQRGHPEKDKSFKKNDDGAKYSHKHLYSWHIKKKTPTITFNNRKKNTPIKMQRVEQKLTNDTTNG
jgi:hypothetical protein